jgi:hypothetical protein
VFYIQQRNANDPFISSRNRLYLQSLTGFGPIRELDAAQLRGGPVTFRTFKKMRVSNRRKLIKKEEDT